MLAEPKSMAEERLGADLPFSLTVLRVQEFKGAEHPRLHLHTLPLLVRCLQPRPAKK